MPKNIQKTKPNEQSAEEFIEKLDARRQEDADTLVDMLSDITGEQPVLWGSSIIGFGIYTYIYSSGRKGDWPRISFSPRKGKITLYVVAGVEKYLDELDHIGSGVTTGKGCVYIKRLSEVDSGVLRRLLERAYADTFALFPGQKQLAK